MKREQGFCVHGVMTSTLLGIPPDARAAILGCAFAMTFDVADYKLPKRFEVYRPIAAGIATEAKRLISEAANRPPAKTGAQRTAEYKARKRAAEVTKVTKVTKGDEGDVRMNERMNERMNGDVSSPPRSDGWPVHAPTADDVSATGKDLGMAPAAVAEFEHGMAELGWEARGRDGNMFPVTPANLKSIMRGWRDSQKKICGARAQSSSGTMAAVPDGPSLEAINAGLL